MRGTTCSQSGRRFLVAAASFLIAVSMSAPGGARTLSAAISGAGSTWAQVAIEQWQADVARQGLAVSYQGTGYYAGLQAYINSSVDFAVTEQPFTSAQLAALATSSRGPAFVYVPVLAGATTAMFNLDVNGRRLTSLRLSPKAACGVFTGRIANWASPVIAADNPGVTLPSLATTAVVDSQPTADSLIFSTWCDAFDHAGWKAFTTAYNLPDAPIDHWPPGVPHVQQHTGSDGVANFVAAPYNNGAIGLVESAYALQRGFPIAALANRSRAFVTPGVAAVQAALRGASTVPGDNWPIVRSSDPAAYPLSIVSYVVAQTKGFDRSKGATLRALLDYDIGQGQQKLGPLGYTPLSARILEVASDRIGAIPH
jgi:phosphate transport system substrate-binding protein